MRTIKHTFIIMNIALALLLAYIISATAHERDAYVEMNLVPALVITIVAYNDGKEQWHETQRYEMSSLEDCYTTVDRATSSTLDDKWRTYDYFMICVFVDKNFPFDK